LLQGAAIIIEYLQAKDVPPNINLTQAAEMTENAAFVPGEW